MESAGLAILLFLGFLVAIAVSVGYGLFASLFCYYPIIAYCIVGIFLLLVFGLIGLSLSNREGGE